MGEPLGAGLEETVDRNGAFPRLGDEQRARLRAVGEVRKVQSGEVLFREGEAGFDFFMIESGVVMIVQGYGHENRIVAVQGPHRFLGEINLLTGSPPYLSAVVRDAGEVIQVSAERLRALVAENEELSNIVLRAYLARREILIDVGAGVKLVGSRYSRCTHRLREFLARNRMPYQWMDLEQDEEADALLQALEHRRLRDAGRDQRRRRAAEPIQRGGREAARVRLSRRSAPALRSGHRRRRAGGSRRGRVRRVGGTRHSGDRHDRVRRPGQHVGANRELPRLPDGDLRQ